MPFTTVESEEARRLANAYEANIGLQHIIEGASESLKKIDELVEKVIVDMTKQFEESLRLATSKIKEEITKATISLDAQAVIARWNVGRLAPDHPTMPVSLMPRGAAAATTSSSTAHILEPERTFLTLIIVNLTMTRWWMTTETKTTRILAL